MERFGAAPLVDRLVDVAEKGKVARLLGEAGEDVILRQVGVLYLVHLNPGVQRLPPREAVRVSREETIRAEDQVREVEGAATGQGGIVVGEQAVWVEAHKVGADGRIGLLLQRP